MAFWIAGLAIAVGLGLGYLVWRLYKKWYWDKEFKERHPK